MRKLLIVSILSLGFVSIAALADESNEAVNRCQAVQQQPEKAPFSCRCFGGPGNYTFTIPAILGTAYGGPGNYPYQTWMCPQGCIRAN